MRICAIDYGDARTDVAVSDPAGLIAGHTEVIRAYRPEVVAERIAAIAREYGVGKIALGHPLNMDGTRGERAQKAEAFAELLRGATGLPVALWDERRTTVDAHRILRANGKNGRQRKNIVDAVAAALILEGYLAWERGQAAKGNHAPPPDAPQERT
jgi:putative Holliday junction resolvase